MFKIGVKLATATLLLAGVLVGCSNAQDTNSEAKTNSGTSKQYTGTITAAGSTALQPLAEEASKEFMAKNPSLSITIQGGGSGAGVNQVFSGNVTIGNSDFPAEAKLKDKTKSDQLIDTKVAGIGFSIVVNGDVNVTNLTSAQIQDIFSGKVTNWKDVGGKDEAINVINRPASSGTRAAFIATVMKDVAINDKVGTVQDSSGAVEKAVNSTPGAISYLANSYLIGAKANVLKALQIDSANPTTDDIVAGKYPFYSYEYMIIKKDNTKEEVQAFVDFIKGDEFATKLEQMGYIPMSKMGSLK